MRVKSGQSQADTWEGDFRSWVRAGPWGSKFRCDLSLCGSGIDNARARKERDCIQRLGAMPIGPGEINVSIDCRLW